MFHFDLSTIIYRGIGVVLALGIHEAAHAIVSFIMGDPTAKEKGRITLNPLAHIDWVGLAFMLLFGIGWAKPVPIDPYYYKDRKTGIVWTAFAGPIANFLLSFVCVFLYFFTFRLLYGIALIGPFIQNVLSFTATISASIGIFNLIPIPPLDGSKVLFAILPDDLYYRAIQENNIWVIILMALIVTGVIGHPISLLTGNLISIFSNFCMMFI
ncbi:MAG: site-2 protease family protein [Firmicutes bacterium]|nr:site-2 protease family protein [Bacillota bacterium]